MSKIIFTLQSLKSVSPPSIPLEAVRLVASASEHLDAAAEDLLKLSDVMYNESVKPDLKYAGRIGAQHKRRLRMLSVWAKVIHTNVTQALQDLFSNYDPYL